jgi:hypothetical protein
MDWIHLDNEAESIVVVIKFKMQKIPCFFRNNLAELSALSLNIVDEISGERGAGD